MRCFRVLFGDETMDESSRRRESALPSILVCRSPSAVIVLNELSFDDPMFPFRAGSHAMTENIIRHC